MIKTGSSSATHHGTCRDQQSSQQLSPRNETGLSDEIRQPANYLAHFAAAPV